MTDKPGHYELWFTRRGDTVRGPFPSRVISDYLLLGRLRPSDEVSHDRATWAPLAQVPQLVPEVLRSPPTPENQRRLELARLHADERLTDRRTGRPVSEAIRELRRGERRQREPIEQLAHRAQRVRSRDSLLVRLELPSRRKTLALGAGVMLALIGVAVWYGSDFALESTRDCAAPPAPRVNWNHCDHAGAVLAGARLERAIANNARLTGADLRRADLRAADLSYADLGAARLDQAVLAGASLRGAVLRDAQLATADLSGADLRYADLRGARLDGARLAGAQLDKAIWIDGRVCAPQSRDRCR